MAKRLTDTDIWKTQRWFRKLDPLDKLAFCYIKDQCNHAGIWKIDCTDLMEDLGIEDFNLQKFITSINAEFDKMSGKRIRKERVIIVKENFLWITGFVQFQYESKEGKVSPDAAPVKTALQILQGYDILKEAFDKGYITLVKPLLTPHATAKDIDIVKDIHSTKKDTTRKKTANWRKIKPAPPPPFNTMPKLEDFGDLPEKYFTTIIGLVKLKNQVKISPETVTALWDVFKVQHLTGGNYYPNEGRVYSHFINIIKKEKFTNDGDGNHQTSGTSRTVNSLLQKDRHTKW